MKMNKVLSNDCLLPQKLNKMPKGQLRMAIADKRHIVEEGKIQVRHVSSGLYESSIN